MASNGVTRPPALDVTMQEILDALKAVSFRPQVIDNLTSQDTGAPLSANQGRVLKDAIDNLVTQSITDGDTSHAPSGDAVHDAINAIMDLHSSYVRFSSGLQICWGKDGSFASSPAELKRTVQFPVAFISPPSVTITPRVEDGDISSYDPIVALAGETENSSFSYWRKNLSSTNQLANYWIAIGLWK